MLFYNIKYVRTWFTMENSERGSFLIRDLLNTEDTSLPRSEIFSWKEREERVKNEADLY